MPAPGSEDEQLICACAPFSRLKGVLLTAGGRPADLFPICFGNTVSTVFQPVTSKAGVN